MGRFSLRFVDRSKTRVQNMELESPSVAGVLDVAQRTDGYTVVDLLEDGRALVRLSRGGAEGCGVWQVVPQE